jgi:hypothetical protein
MLILGGEVDMKMGRPPSDEMKGQKEILFEGIWLGSTASSRGKKTAFVVFTKRE